MGNKYIKHSKSAGGVVLNKKGQVLIVNQDGVSWSFPKGHANKKESDLNVARREVFEESGITNLFLKKDLGSYQRTNLDDENELKTIHIFLFKTDQIKLKPIDLENPEAKWVEKDEVADTLTHPKDKDFFLNIIKEI